MSGHPQQETQLFKMSDDFKHLITVLPPHSAYETFETLGLKPQALIEKLEYAINTARRPEQRTELQRLDDKRRFKPFLALLEQVIQDWRLKKFINQTLAFLLPDSEAVQELYAEEDGLKLDRKETKAATLTDSLIQPFKLDGNLKTVLIMSLQDAFDATEPAQKATSTASAKLDPAEDINKLESEISRYSAEQQTALEKLNRAEEMIPFLQKLNSLSNKNSFLAKITEMLLLSLQLAIFPASPASSQKNAIKLPPLSNSGPDLDDDGLYEYVGHDLHEAPLDSLFPAYGDLGTPSQPIMGTNAAQQVPPGSPTPSADGKPSGRYTQPGSVVRRISFTHNIGQPPASSINPPGPGKKSLEEEMPLLPTVNPTK